MRDGSEKYMNTYFSFLTGLLLRLKHHLFATSGDRIYWNSSPAFCMKMEASSEVQKHDVMRVFIYSLSPHHIEHAIYQYLMEKEGKAPETVMLTGCCWERASDCGAFENMLGDVFQHEGMRGMILAEKNLTCKNWICDGFDSMFLHYLQARQQHLLWQSPSSRAGLL